MDHRLPLIVALLCACSGSGEGTPDGETPRDATDTSATSYVVGPQQWFDWTVDGVTRPLFTTEMSLASHSGPSCDTTYSMMLLPMGDREVDGIGMILGSATAVQVGSTWQLGTRSDGELKASMYFYEEQGGAASLVMVSAEELEITALGVDVFEVEFTDGTLCPFEVGPGDDDASCPTFTSASLELVSVETPFDPDAVHCEEDSATTDGFCRQHPPIDETWPLCP